MYGVALEGGGARGAYQVGAMKAVYEAGFEIGAIVGTSIGSFNAAVLAQGDFDKLYNLWYKGSSRIVIDIPENELKKAVSKKVDIDSMIYWTKYVLAGLNSKGIDVSKLRQLYSKYIDEDKLRKSKVEYGTVTYSLTDKKPVYIYKDDIPEGNIADYIVASSYFPVFKQEKILDDKYYIDGGVYDNCPVQLLVNKGYDDIIEIRTEAIGVNRKVKRKKASNYVVRPSKDLGNILFSDNTLMRKNILMGYYDARRVFNKNIGKKFYVIPCSDDTVFSKITAMSDEKINMLSKYIKQTADMNSYEPKKMLFESIIPSIALKLKGKEYDISSYQKLIISVIEFLFDDKNIKIYKEYTFSEILSIAKKKATAVILTEQNKIIKNNNALLMLKFILCL